MKNQLVVLVLLLLPLYKGMAQTANNVIEKYYAQSKTDNELQSMTMTLINKKGAKRERSLTQYILWETNDVRKMRLVFSAPADIKGTGFLSLEQADDQDINWLYLPVLRRSRRISASDITDKFMGSDFTYEDLDKEELKEFSYRLLSDNETVKGEPCFKIEATPKTAAKIAETGYSKRILYISKSKYLLVEAMYYNKNNIHFKTFESSDFKKIDGSNKWRSFKMTMTDILSDHSTELLFQSIQHNTSISEEDFTKRVLEKGV